MDRRPTPRLLVLVAVVAGVFAASACGSDKPKTASPAASAPVVADSSPAAADPSAGASDPSAAASSDPSAGPGGTCSTAAMTEAVYGGASTGGTTYSGVALTNKSQSACTVSGFPTIEFADANGKAFKVTISHARAAATKFTVAPGGKAYFTVRLGDKAAANEKAPCDPPADAMLISLSSNGSDALTDQGPWHACGTKEVGPLTPKPDPNLHK
jgi:hypothetical protein